MPENAQLLARLQEAFDLGGLDGAHAAGEIIEALYGEMVESWHGYPPGACDGPKPRAEARQATIREREILAAFVTDFHYEDVRLIVCDRAIVTTFRTSGRLPDGSDFEFPICVIYRRDADGWIVRTEAWADGLTAQELRQKSEESQRRSAE